MQISIPDFWKLVIESHLLSAQQCQQLGSSFGHVKGAAGNSTARTLAEWLVAEGALSRFQATVLLSGRAGPFFYGEYKVYDRIDKGRFQGNFRAVHVPSNHPVQLQFLTGATVQDAQAWTALATVVQHRFLHPSPLVQRYFDLVDAGSFKFLVTEDLAGDTLEQRLLTSGRLPPAEACAVIREAAAGLAHLHQLSFVHGALLPDEIWIGDHGSAKLLHDPSRPVFPLAAYASDPAEEFARRADYAAPELAHPQQNPDILADIYALGCVFYQSLSGAVPFAGGTAYEKLQRHAVEAIQPLDRLGVPQAVEQVVMYMMAKNPSVRFPQAHLVADQLTPFCDPARQFARPSGDLPTMGSFEAHMRQRWAAGLPLAGAQQAPQASNATAPIPSGVAMSSVGRSDAPTSSAPRSTTVKSTTMKSHGTAATEGSARPSIKLVDQGSAKVGTRREREPAGVAARQGNAASAVAGVSSANPARAPSAAERLREGRKPNQRTTWIVGGSLGAAAVVSLIVVLVILNSGRQPPAESPEVAQQGETSGGSAEVSPVSNSKVNDPLQGASNAATKPGEKISSKPGEGTSTKPTLPSEKPTPPRSETAFEQVIVPDDGASLWASPTTGAPIELDLVPLDSHFLLHVRAAELLESEEGPKFVQACGPALQNLMTQWEAAAGVKLTDVEQLLFSLHDAGDDWPRSAVVVRLRQPLTEEELVAKWGNPAPMAVKDSKVYQGAGWSYYVPAKPLGVFLMGTAEDVKQVAEQRGAPPPLRRELGVLRRLTDSDRQLTFLATPNFLTTNLLRDGRAYYFGDGKRLREPIDWFLRDELQAVMCSMHFGNDTYLEMRMIGNQGKDKFTLAKEVRDRLSQIPDLLFEYIATLGANPYWERVRLRYPGMITFLHGKTRIGADADTAAINCRLPRAAAHNLAFGTEMVLVSTPGAPAAVVANPAAAVTGKPSAATMTIDDILFKHITSMSFEAQSLEFAIQDIAKDVNETLKGLPFEFKIKILGEDLQLDGITRNQTVRDFMHKDKSVADILTAMVMKANSPAAPDPSKPEQKLLWVIDKDPDDPSKPIVLVTTRAAAEKKKFTLPMPFKPK